MGTLESADPVHAALPALTPRPGVDTAEILSALLDWTHARGFTLYPAQEEAIMAGLEGKHVVLSTPTGSGKSLVAIALVFAALSRGTRAYYTCPVKALCNEKFFELCAIFGRDRVGLGTGDARVNGSAPLQVVTAEVLANQCLSQSAAPACVVMDEFHYYADRERGMAWQVPLLSLPGTQFLLMSATLGDMNRIMSALVTRTGREAVHVRGMQRPVPLTFEYRDTVLQETVADLVRADRAPIYLVNFTQQDCVTEAQSLTSLDLTSRVEKAALAAALRDERFPTSYGKELQRLLRVGIGVHHGGLLPRYRRLVERLAQAGLLKLISGTDTLGVGVNIPIRTVLFTRLCKFDGEKARILPVREFLQIAGRAGRRGFDNEGFVVAQAPAHVIENQRLAQKGKKFVRKQPPQKGFVHWDRATFERLVTGQPEPLESRFSVSQGVLLQTLRARTADPRRGGGYRLLLDLIGHSHETPGSKQRLKRVAAQAFRTLRAAGLIALVRDERARNPYPVLSADLQADFSLEHTLGLYLVETLPLLRSDIGDDHPARAHDHALSVLSLVEAILENPRPILLAQRDRERARVLAELKASGVDYEERMQELEKVDWPKPNCDFIYETFNAFSARHPYVGSENIAPKGVARELIERNLGFGEMVRELGVGRSEGVLLRYLSSVYRTLVHGVPVAFRTPELEEIIAYLDATVRLVDASLLEEWLALGPGEEPTPVRAAASVRTALVPLGQRLARDARALHARVRAELHRLLQALARGDYGEALDAIAPEDEEGHPWTADRLAGALAPFLAENGAIDIRVNARAPALTRIVQEGPLRYSATQVLLGTKSPGEPTEWALHVLVDLSDTARIGLPDEAPPHPAPAHWRLTSAVGLAASPG